MPCVCLTNTFHYWQRLATEKPVKVKSASQRHIKTESRPQRSIFHRKVKPAKDIAERGLFSDSKVLRVPHPPRTRIISDAPKAPAAISHSGKPTRADLINAESQLGSAIFGPIPAGHRREFFHDQQNIWIWHEDWRDGDNLHQMTVRYEVRTSGIYKKISTGKYFKLEGEELTNFRRATRAYLYMIKKYLYNRPKATA